MTMKRVECAVQEGGSLSKDFGTHKGLKQGDNLACLLFNMALECAVRLH